MKGPYKILISILFAMLLLSSGLRIVLSGDIREKQALLNRVSAQLSQSRQSGSLQNDASSEKRMEEFINENDSLFYPELVDEDLIRIGLELSETIRSTGNEIKSYNLVNRNGRGGFHYQLDTSMPSLLKLIRALSAWPQYLRIENLTIHASQSKTSAGLIISPAVLSLPDEKSEEILSAGEALAFIEVRKRESSARAEGYLIRRLFNFPRPRREAVLVETPQEPTPQAPPPPRMAEGPAWLCYVGMSVNESKRLYYILDKRTNRTFELLQGADQSPYRLLEVKSDRIILMIDGEERYVYK